MIEKLKTIPILDVAVSLGLSPKRVGSYYTLKEHDSIRINAGKNLFVRNSTGEAGSVIDFVCCITGKSTGEAIRYLEGIGGIKKADIKAQPEKLKARLSENLPAKDNNARNVFAYLIKSRGIDKGIVEKYVKENVIYQDTYKNAVFVYYENSWPVFACKRGTNTYKRFVADVSGSDYKKGFWFRNGAEKVIICEGVIDALSIMSLKALAGYDFLSEDYLVLAGTGKWEELMPGIKNYREVIVMTDNDEAGRQVAEKIKEEMVKAEIPCRIELPEMKDYNDELLTLRRESVCCYKSRNIQGGK